MKYSWQIMTMLLAVALIVLVAKLFTMQTQLLTGGAVNKADIIIENIMTRSSVRSYTDQKVSNNDIETMLKAGMAAPSGGNKQPWELLVVTDREILDAIPSIAGGAHMAKKAPLAIVVCGSPTRAMIPGYWIQDCSAVTENILLAAHGLGLGAVWCGAYPDNNTGRVERANKLFNLPEDILALAIIVIGHPDKEPTVKDKWEPSKVRYNRY